MAALYGLALQPLSSLCPLGDKDTACLFSARLYTAYLSYWALLLAGGGALAHISSQKLRIVALLGGTLWLSGYAYDFTVAELSDIRTHGYEFFLALFYAWEASIASFFLTALLFPVRLRFLAWSSLLLTLLVLPPFAMDGRGGSEQITALAGGLFAEISWRAAWLSKLLKLWAFMAGTALVAVLLVTLSRWIISGYWSGSYARQAARNLLFIPLSAIALTSLIPGDWINRRDVAAAKAYIESMTPALQAHRDAHQSYPKLIGQIAPADAPKPRLLARYDFLAHETDGGFYLSRQDKYCFLFQDPGSDFGYWSLTSERGWRLTREGGELEEQYLSVCDEGKGNVYESLLADHLGLSSPDAQPGQAMRPALTAGATARLQEELDKLGAKDPSIYGGEPEKKGPPLAESVEELRQLLRMMPYDAPRE